MTISIQKKDSYYPIPLDKIIDESLVTIVEINEKKATLAILNKSQVKYLPKNEVIKNVALMIGETSFKAGMKIENGSKVHEIVSADILRDFSFLTIDEIELAFYLGARKHYGEYMGLSVISFYGFLKGYVLNERKQAIKFVNNYWDNIREAEEQKKKQELSLKEFEKERDRKIEHIHAYITGEVDKLKLTDLNNILYDHLEKIGIINLSIQEKHVIFNKAQEQYKKELIEKEKAKKKVPLSDKIMENNFGDLIKAIITENRPDIIIIKSLAKDMSLLQTIEKLKTDKVNFVELYKQALKHAKP